MKNIIKILSFVVIATIFAGCPKTDDDVYTAPKAYSEQKPIDEAAIDDFLDTHYVTVDANYNTTFTLIETGGTQTPISQMTNLETISVNRNDLDYTLKYLKLNEGTGDSPIKVDSAFVIYKGTLLDDTVFDTSQSPVWFKLDEVVAGWGEIIPKFKTGTSDSNPNGTVTYRDFGAGVMFLPSSFGYYNSSIGVIPSYSQLIFNFKLIDQFHRDHDFDKVLSMYEYYDSDGNILDTDGDEIYDYVDFDDDGDGFLTKNELQYTDVNGDTQYYEFANIPMCSGGSLKRHLDPSCHN